jgi:hypothetical protein
MSILHMMLTIRGVWLKGLPYDGWEQGIVCLSSLVYLVRSREQVIRRTRLTR